MVEEIHRSTHKYQYIFLLHHQKCSYHAWQPTIRTRYRAFQVTVLPVGFPTSWYLWDRRPPTRHPPLVFPPLTNGSTPKVIAQQQSRIKWSDGTTAISNQMIPSNECIYGFISPGPWLCHTKLDVNVALLFLPCARVPRFWRRCITRCATGESSWFVASEKFHLNGKTQNSMHSKHSDKISKQHV